MGAISPPKFWKDTPHTWVIICTEFGSEDMIMFYIRNRSHFL